MQDAPRQPPEIPVLEVHLPPAKPLRPLEAFTGSLAQRVYASLREARLSIFFRPGDILRKPKICTQSGVSRTPFFEAVTRLAVEHLVRTVPHRAPKWRAFRWPRSAKAPFCPRCWNW